MTSKIKLLALVATFGLFASLQGAKATEEEYLKCHKENCMPKWEKLASGKLSGAAFTEEVNNFTTCVDKCKADFARD